MHQIATLPNYLLDGVAFYVDPTQQAGDVAMYRYYDTSGIGAGEHFYTDSSADDEPQQFVIRKPSARDTTPQQQP